MNPEQLTSTPTEQDLLNEEIQKLAMKTRLEVQQGEDIRRDLAERMKFVPPDLRGRESVFYWQEDPIKIQKRTEVWKMVEGGDSCCQGCVHFSSKCKQTEKTFGYGGSGKTSRFALPDRSTCAVAFL